MKRHTLTWLGPGLALVVGSTSPGHAQDCSHHALALGWNQQPLTAFSGRPHVSFDGSRILFSSQADNLVPGHVGPNYDVYLLEVSSGAVQAVSLSDSGAWGNGSSDGAALSADNRFAVFLSGSSNLDPGDTDTLWDVYLRDVQLSTTMLISRRQGTGPSVLGCAAADISAAGRFVAFDCSDDNVVPGDTNNRGDVFVYDRVLGVTELVSLGPGDVQGNQTCRNPSISFDGRFVAFEGSPTNWWPATHGGMANGIFVRDRYLGITVAVTLIAGGTLCSGMNAQISADGQWVAFVGTDPDYFPAEEILVWNRHSAGIEWISRRLPGSYVPSFNRDPEISADGRFITWASTAPDLVVQPGPGHDRVFLRDRDTGVTMLVDPPPTPPPPYFDTTKPSISASGRTVAFEYQGLIQWRTCDVASPQEFCGASATSAGCIPRLSWSGTPSVGGGLGFVLDASDLPVRRIGGILYGIRGPQGSPLGNGWLCVLPPWTSLGMAGTGGAGGKACDGHLVADFGSWLATGADPRLIPGQAIHAQAWVRDPSDPAKVALSGGVAFVVEP